MARTATIYYLERLRIYKQTKPYIFAYDLPKGIGPNTNHSYKPYEVEIEDAQDNMRDFSLDKHGFEFHECKTSLSAEDFDSIDTIKARYYPEVISHLEKMSPAGTEFHVLAHVRRKRRSDFPQKREINPEVLSPILFAHVDFSSLGAEVAIKHIFCDNEHLRNRKFDMVNVWRPTRGPNRDWPLGMCDFGTLDHNDIEVTDVIHRDYTGESLRLYANPRHKWHFLDNQTTDQVVIFRNMHSGNMDIPFAAHVAFPFTSQNETAFQPRESIEMRVVRFF